MNSLYLLIPIALVFVAIAIRALFWAINSGQYDNLDTEAHRILFDDAPASTREGAAGADPKAEAADDSDEPEPNVKARTTSAPGESGND